jgi:hypothetical protein
VCFLQAASGRFRPARIRTLITMLLVALAIALAYPAVKTAWQEGEQGDGRGPLISSIDLAGLNIDMSSSGVLTALGDPQGRRSEGSAGSECWRYPTVGDGFARLCFHGGALVSMQQTSARSE